MRILIVFGTRPEAIKMAPIVKAVEKNPQLESIVCTTAQHREMLDQVLKVFDILPKYDLNIMGKDQDLFNVTVQVLNGIKDILLSEQPDIVLVQGDTTTAFAAGLAAYYCKIPVAHVEAGLRTYDKYSPFPEEINRHLLSVIVDYHFAPTELAKSNLAKESIPERRIWVTGNTVVDAILATVENLKSRPKQDALEKYFKEKLNISVPHASNNTNPRLVLVTGHRRENFGEGLKNICLALTEIAKESGDLIIVYPVHLNPNVQGPVRSILNEAPNIHLIQPLSYEPFIFLMSRAYLILTDSGGLQEEAPSLNKPLLVMRNITERPEGIQAGTAKLVGTDKATIVRETLELLQNPEAYRRMSSVNNPYGDGRAAERIVNLLFQECQPGNTES